MRSYRVYYYKEINDECVDCEIVIEVPRIDNVISEFKEQVQLFKRITKIEELSYGVSRN
jgi:hypothetical protein